MDSTGACGVLYADRAPGLGDPRDMHDQVYLCPLGARGLFGKAEEDNVAPFRMNTKKGPFVMALKKNENLCFLFQDQKNFILSLIHPWLLTEGGSSPIESGV